MLQKSKKSIVFNELKDKFQQKNRKFLASLTPDQKSFEKLSDFIDEYLIHALASKHSVAVIALGGYGRRERMPFSDVDILFLHDTQLEADEENELTEITNSFWELGIKPACTVLPIKACDKKMAQDVIFLTSLLDRRHVTGSSVLVRKLDKIIEDYRNKTSAGIFLEAKLAERDVRHVKTGGSRYALEPDVKEGKGGLRDIQTLLWLADFLYGVKTPQGLARKKILTEDEAKTLTTAHEFFMRVRWHLHIKANKAQERLTFDLQPDIAEKMGYLGKNATERAERFMRDYFRMARNTGYLTRILCAELEAHAIATGGTAGTRKMSLKDQINGFPLRYNRLSVDSEEHFRNAPADMVRIFRVAQTSGYDIHPDALRLIRQLAPTTKLEKDKTSHNILRDILLDGKKAEYTLRCLHEAGLMTRLIPDFSNIDAHMQYDMYHTYTADEHTIRAVGLMHALENGHLAEAAPLATTLFGKISSRKSLYAAMLLHDIAKGTGGAHAEKGADIAHNVCPLLGLSVDETDTTAWLIEHHLLMTMTALKRDLNDPKTIDDFIAEVRSPERLKLLAILTTADVMAVGTDKWNSWKSGLIDTLYAKAAARMTGSPDNRSLQDQAIIAQKQVRRIAGENRHSLQLLCDHAPADFWFSFIPEDIIRFAGLLKETSGHIIKATPGADRTEVLVYTPDRPGLFAKLTGGIAAAGGSIVDARIFTLSNGMALDLFQIQTSSQKTYENLKYIEKILRLALDEKLDPSEEIQQRQKLHATKGRIFEVPSRVIIDNSASNTHTLIEINTRDRAGLLYNLASAISSMGLQISSAKIATFGRHAVDVFYVKNNFGLKILHPEKLLSIEKTIKNILEK